MLGAPLAEFSPLPRHTPDQRGSTISDMRDGFEHFLPPGDGYWARLASHGTYAFDTNVLLDFYRITESARVDLTRRIRDLGERRWIPHQVAREFHERRHKVRLDLLSDYKKARDAVSASIRGLGECFPNAGRHPYLEPDLSSEAVGSLNSLATRLEAIRTEHDAEASGAPSSDAIGESVFDLFAGLVGDAYDSTRLNQIEKEGRARFKAKTPPGFEDAGKEENEFGDLSFGSN